MTKYQRRVYPDHKPAPLRRPLGDDRDFWETALDLTERVAVYWPSSAGSVDVVGYYNTVSAANTAARANENSFGSLPRVAVNWNHTSITHVTVGPSLHRDATADMPSWYDEAPV